MIWMLTFYVNVLFVTKMTCKCAQETSSQCQLSHSVHTICWCSHIVVSEDSSLGKFLPAFQRILVTSSLGSSSTRGAAATLALLDPDHDIINPFRSYVEPRPTVWFSCSAPMSEDVWHGFCCVCSPTVRACPMLFLM
jgi:hypothetical protein